MIAAGWLAGEGWVSGVKYKPGGEDRGSKGRVDKGRRGGRGGAIRFVPQNTNNKTRATDNIMKRVSDGINQQKDATHI